LFTTLVKRFESEKEVPTYGKISFRSNHCCPQTQTVFPSTHNSGLDGQTITKDNEQFGGRRTIGLIGNRAQ